MPIPDAIKQAARDLRKKQTKAEQLLWDRLRRKKEILKAYRQKPICVMEEDNAQERYVIVDFYFPFGKTIVEIDGSIHNLKEVYLLDREKEKLLGLSGYKVLRFTNEELFRDIDEVLRKIAASFSS